MGRRKSHSFKGTQARPDNILESLPITNRRQSSASRDMLWRVCRRQGE